MIFKVLPVMVMELTEATLRPGRLLALASCFLPNLLRIASGQPVSEAASQLGKRPQRAGETGLGSHSILRPSPLCRLRRVLCAADVATLPGRPLLILKNVKRVCQSPLGVRVWEAGFPRW